MIVDKVEKFETKIIKKKVEENFDSLKLDWSEEKDKLIIKENDEQFLINQNESLKCDIEKLLFSI